METQTIKFKFTNKESQNLYLRHNYYRIIESNKWKIPSDRTPVPNSPPLAFLAPTIGKELLREGVCPTIRIFCESVSLCVSETLNGERESGDFLVATWSYEWKDYLMVGSQTPSLYTRKDKEDSLRCESHKKV
eukprot:1186482-Prorocentrum_minimum.AAC.1